MKSVLKKELPETFKIKVNKRQYQILRKCLKGSVHTDMIEDMLNHIKELILFKDKHNNYLILWSKNHPCQRIRFKDYFEKEKKPLTYEQMVSLISKTNSLVMTLRDLYRDKQLLPNMVKGSMVYGSTEGYARHPEPGDVPTLRKPDVSKIIAESKINLQDAYSTKKT